MDSVRDLMMRSQQQQHYQPHYYHRELLTGAGSANLNNGNQRNNHLINGNNNNVVTVEEAMDCREANSRFFSLFNHESNLNVIVSKTSTLISCKLDGHEIVIDHLKQCQQTHETWAIGDRPFQKINSLPWNCHVRGAELMLSTSNGSSSIIFELTRFNELNSFVKLKSIHLQNQVVYYNLNNAKEKRPIDGHTLVVRCNGSSSRIQVQNTKLLCHCNKKASILPQSLIGDIPFELMQHDSSMSLQLNSDESVPNDLTNHNNDDDDLIVCDAIFSLSSTCPLDYLQVQLQYQNRALVFETRSSQLATAVASNATLTGDNNNSAKVSSSTASNAAAAVNLRSLDNSIYHQQASSSTATSITNYDDQDRWLSSLVDSPSTSGACQEPMSHPLPLSQEGDPINALSAPSSSSATTLLQPNTILRVRIRVTNFGVSIMPLMMTNYCCSLRFTW